jgi:hypothetical protein
MPSVWSFSRGSVTALPVFDKSKLEHQISLDSLTEKPVGGASLGSTSDDKRDMARMGRIQELRVRICSLSYHLRSSTLLILK